MKYVSPTVTAGPLEGVALALAFNHGLSPVPSMPTPQRRFALASTNSKRILSLFVSPLGRFLRNRALTYAVFPSMFNGIVCGSKRELLAFAAPVFTWEPTVAGVESGASNVPG